MRMNKSFTNLSISSQKNVENTNLAYRVKFLQDYCRAYTIIKTNSIPSIEYFCN